MYKMFQLKTLASAVVIGGFIVAANAQLVTPAWTRTLNGTGSGSDIVRKIKTDDLGNVYVTGTSIGSGSGSDILTIKYSPAGAQLWQRRFNGTGNSADEPTDMAVDHNGNVYVTGNTTSSGTGINFVTLKYNAAGTLQWTRVYDGPSGADNAKAIAIQRNGDIVNIVVAGSTGAGGTARVLKYDSDGNTLFNYAYNGPDAFGSTSANAVAIQGTSIFIGGHTHNGTNGEDIMMIKLTTNGVAQTIQTFNGSFGGEHDGGFGNIIEDSGNHIAVDSTGNIYVAGYVMRNFVSINDPTPVNDYILVKWTNSGAPLWSRQSGELNIDEWVTALLIDSQDNPIIVGSNNIRKYNMSGTLLWNRDFGYTAGALGPDDGIYVTKGGTNMSTAYFRADGTMYWSTAYNGPSNVNDFGMTIATSPTGNVFVGGYSANPNPNGNDFVTIKYVQFPYVKVDTSHSYWGDLKIEVGVGNPNAPLWSKVIRNREGGSSSGDVSTLESISDAPPFYQHPSESVVWYCKVTDMASADTGTITLFRVQTQNGTYSSGNVPAAIPDLGSANVYVPTRTAQHAIVDIQHTFRGDLRITVGVGPQNAPFWSRIVTDRTGGNLDDMWCQVDVSQAAAYLPPLPSQSWWVKVEDLVPGDTGQLKAFTVRNNALTWNASCLPLLIWSGGTTYGFIPKLVGDTNCDNCVNDVDLLEVLLNFGAIGQNMPGDLDGNGIINDNDLLLVLLNFGIGCE